MSVILFNSHSTVYAELAQSYEGLKQYISRSFTEDDDYHFYKALRRIHFANVGCFLCQYHDDSPLGDDELCAIDPFQDPLLRENPPAMTPRQLVEQFVEAWSHLKYNLVTNDGEEYQAMESYQILEDLAIEYQRCLNSVEQSSI
jgi:hypothetical protein